LFVRFTIVLLGTEDKLGALCNIRTADLLQLSYVNLFPVKLKKT
jgi:hypothetical protein